MYKTCPIHIASKGTVPCPSPEPYIATIKNLVLQDTMNVNGCLVSPFKITDIKGNVINN
jgi:hypothetical protein